jgi:Pyruvate/2-oxoacid:ferredoxin oxidoreductase delta subunit
MLIDPKTCIGCGNCVPYCPVGAIVKTDQKTRKGKEIRAADQGRCVECGVCLRAAVCPTDSISMPQLVWPRLVRALFSDPLTLHPTTKLEGRGTEEMKTNDVTGRFKRGMAGVGVEMGRPGIGATFRDIQTVCMALAKLGAEFEPQNPLSALIADKKTGELDPEVMGEKVLSAIIEFSVSNDGLKDALRVLKEVSTRIDTVFSLCVIGRVDADGTIPVRPLAAEVGFVARANTKTNVGLGRPRKEDE